MALRSVKQRLGMTRSRGLAWTYERAAYLKQRLATREMNRGFRRAHPDFAVPPYGVLRDATATTSYDAYRSTGIDSAAGFWEAATRWALPARDGRSSEPPFQVLEWGCGPARIIRHLPQLADQMGLPAEFTGTDINRRSIRWAAEHIEGIRFLHHELQPPLPVPSGTIDFVYGWSVLTHLSAEMHRPWVEELARIARPGGVIALSTHGVALRERLLPTEQARFDRGEAVEITTAGEGSLMYATFQPESFMREVFAGLEILDHGRPAAGQEMWIVRTPAR